MNNQLNLPPTTQLRNLLATPGVLVAPGCYDAVSAKLIERAGFSELAVLRNSGHDGGRVRLPEIPVS